MSKEPYTLLKYMNSQKALEQHYQFVSARGNKKISYLYQLNEAIDGDKNVLIINKDKTKNKIIISYDEYCKLKKGKSE